MRFRFRQGDDRMYPEGKAALIVLAITVAAVVILSRIL